MSNDPIIGVFRNCSCQDPDNVEEAERYYKLVLADRNRLRRRINILRGVLLAVKNDVSGVLATEEDEP